MLEALKTLFCDDAGADKPTLGDDARLAATALLVETAAIDGNLDGVEGQRILTLLGDRFALASDKAKILLDKARTLQRQSSQIYPFTKVIVDHFDAPHRIGVLEMLWEVAYANGRLHDLEASLIRRVAGLLFVSDQASGAARKTAMIRLGLPVA
jgi:uncharacterized tellurite resistance protein B-like protein